MANVVGAKGQVVIEKAIRDELGIKPGWVAVQTLVGDHLELQFVPPPHRRSLKGSLARHVRRRIAAGDAWRRAREKSWGEAAAEKERR